MRRQDVANTGLISVTSTANATADNGDASAEATLYVGLGAIAYSHGTGNTADVTLTNSDEIEVASLRGSQCDHRSDGQRDDPRRRVPVRNRL